MNRILKITRLQLNKTLSFVSTPPLFLLTMLVLSFVISLAIQRATGVGPESPTYIASARWNQAMVWSLPGYLVYFGVQAVGTTYPLALALGATRRDFVLGTMMTNVLHSIYIGVLVMIALGIEILTHHWFLGVYVLDVYFFGAGDYVIAGGTATLGTLFFLTIGGLFAGLWVRFGARGPLVLGLGGGLILAVVLLALAPNLGTLLPHITSTLLAVIVVALIILALVGTWFAMRKASVR